MNVQWIRRGLPVALLVFLIMGFAAIGIRAASTPTDSGHMGHHGGTPTSTDACLASPGGMMMSTPASTAMMGTPMAGATMNQDVDLIFIDMMIPHHESAIVMAQVALERGEHQEIRDLAQNVIDSQSAEITQMQAWRAAWYPHAPVMPMDQMTQRMGEMMQGSHDAGMGGMHHGSDMAMMDPASSAAALCDTTEPFDQAFIDMMIPHHQGAVQMAEVALEHATHPEIKQLAQAVVDAQQQEIAQMEAWRIAWYASAQTVEEVFVTLSEFALEASRTDFQAGQTYRFVITNNGVIDHEFMILPHMADTGQQDMDALHEVALLMVPTNELTPGATATVEVTIPETTPDGGWELVCAIAGHYNAGMVLPITVSA